MDIQKIQNKLKKIADERDWNQFHTPKNLVSAISVECAELLEIFQWLNETESQNIMESEKAENVRDEVADVATYLIRLCSILDIDLEKAIHTKLEKSVKKYPVEKSYGSAKKYTELD